MDQEMRDMFQAVLDRLKVFEIHVDERFDRIDTTLEQMQHEINACRLEKESIELLIKKGAHAWNSSGCAPRKQS